MLLKFKNKHILAIDKMIKESESIKGIIDRIELDPKEAYGLLLEVSNLGKEYVSTIKIHDRDNVDVTHQELIWNGAGLDKNEHIKTIIQKWYKTHYTITYKDIPIRIVKPVKTLPPPAKKEDSPWMEKHSSLPKPPSPPPARSVTGKKVPLPPLPPPNRLIVSEPWVGICDICGSSKKTKWVLFDTDKCIQPECENYWDKKT